MFSGLENWISQFQMRKDRNGEIVRRWAVSCAYESFGIYRPQDSSVCYLPKAASYRNDYRWVCGKEFSHAARWLHTVIKFIADSAMVADIVYSLRRLKSSVLMYPEASYSFDGTQTPLPRSVGKRWSCLTYRSSWYAHMVRLAPIRCITVWGLESRCICGSEISVFTRRYPQ